MKDIFSLEFMLNNIPYKFQVTAQHWGNGKRYAIRVNDVGYLYSPDNEGKFNFVIVPGQPGKFKDEDIGLLDAIGQEFEKLSKAKAKDS